MPQLRTFMNNTFILDEHRSTLVALKPMKVSRADHALHIEGGNIYVLGGMRFNPKGGAALPRWTSTRMPPLAAGRAGTP